MALVGASGSGCVPLLDDDRLTLPDSRVKSSKLSINNTADAAENSSDGHDADSGQHYHRYRSNGISFIDEDDDEDSADGGVSLPTRTTPGIRCLPLRFHVWLRSLPFLTLFVVLDCVIVILLAIVHFASATDIGESLRQSLITDQSSFVNSFYDLTFLALFRSITLVVYNIRVSKLRKTQIRSHSGYAIDAKLGVTLIVAICIIALSLQDIILKLIFHASNDTNHFTSDLSVAGIAFVAFSCLTSLVIIPLSLISRKHHIIRLYRLLQSNRSHEHDYQSQSLQNFVTQIEAQLQSEELGKDWDTIIATENQRQREKFDEEERKTKRLQKQEKQLNDRAMGNFALGGEKERENEKETQNNNAMQSKGVSDGDSDKASERADEAAEDATKMSKGEIAARILRLWREDSLYLLFAFIFMVIAAVSGLTIPAFTGSILTEALSNDLSMASMYYWLCLIIFTGVSTQIRGYLFTVAGENFVARLRKKLHSHLLLLDIEFYDREKIGDFSSTLTSDCDVVKDSISLNFNVFMRSTIAIVGAGCYMLYLDPLLSLVTFSSMPVFGVLSLVYGTYEKNQSKKIQDLTGSANAQAIQSLSSIRTIASYHKQAYEDWMYSIKIEESRQLAVRKAFWYGCYADATSILGDISSWNTLLFGYHLLTTGRITASSLSQFIFFSAYLVANLQSISWIWQGLMKSLGSGERIFRLLDRQPEIWPINLDELTVHHNHKSQRERQQMANDALVEEEKLIHQKRLLSTLAARPSSVSVNSRFYHTYLPPLHQHYLVPPTQFTGHIKFNDVCFSYPLAPDKLVLKNVSFELKPGSVMALVGASGSGKSSIVTLIQRFYEITSGSIELDGIDIRLLSPAWRAKSIGLVQQEATIFARSIKENIAYGLLQDDCSNIEEIDQSVIEEAARQAHAHEFIARLAKGYDSILGERGCSLSGGQRSRIAIARALALHPNCLIFDEATAALDTKSEMTVQRAIDAICERKDKSVIIIAHRLSTIKNADIIYVMEHGEIVEAGSHHQLLENKSFYYQLVQAQVDTEDTNYQPNDRPTNVPQASDDEKPRLGTRRGKAGTGDEHKEM